jgi:hypothetical protein
VGNLLEHEHFLLWERNKVRHLITILFFRILVHSFNEINENICPRKQVNHAWELARCSLLYFVQTHSRKMGHYIYLRKFYNAQEFVSLH